MNRKIKMAAVAAVLAVTAGVTVVVADLDDEQRQQIAGDFRNAAQVEVRDAQGQVLLRGTFTPQDADDQGEVEKLATLAAVANDLKATGEAEFEYQADTPGEQELEFTISGLNAGADVALVVDGRQVATARADRRGKVEIELLVKTAQ